MTTALLDGGGLESSATTVVLDTPVLHWWAAEPDRLGAAAAQALQETDQMAVAGTTWLELAWLAGHERILVSTPIGSWLQQLAREVRTFGVTPAIADTLPDSHHPSPATLPIA